MSTEKILINPIANSIKDSIEKSTHRLNLAVPFISGYAKKILSEENIKNLVDKRLITRFDDSNINTFNLPTLLYFLKNGFDIRYDNEIHLKLYITDDDAFVTSSNLTQGGLENNIELTVSVDSKNHQDCVTIFNHLWEKSKQNTITSELIELNLAKYYVLERRSKYNSKKIAKVSESLKVIGLNTEKLLDVIINSKRDYSKIVELSYQANKFRNNFKHKLLKEGFNSTLFFSGEGLSKKNKDLLYVFAHGIEDKLASTGLRENQYQIAFQHPEFRKAVDFIFPDSLGLPKWDLEDEKSFYDFCNGLFDFNIPHFATTLPIRLASFLYPEHIYPIFKLKDFKRICEDLGMQSDASTNGDQLFAYNLFLTKKTKEVPYNSYIKSRIAYELLYSVELFNKLKEGFSYEEVLASYNRQWIRNYIEQGRKNLEVIKAININSTPS